MLIEAPLVFLLDVDNTLFDNDRFAADLLARLTQDFGEAGCDRYWAIYEERRAALGYADYLGSLQQFRVSCEGDPKLLGLSQFLLDYPFAAHLLPRAMAAIAYLGTLGKVVILSDGDAVFQPHKIQQSGLFAAVSGQVQIYLHKQHSLVDLQNRHPAKHYVMVDDKPDLLAAMKTILGERLTTVFVRQGHYAAEALRLGIERPPDLQIEKIGDLLQLGTDSFLSTRETAAQV